MEISGNFREVPCPEISNCFSAAVIPGHGRDSGGRAGRCFINEWDDCRGYACGWPAEGTGGVRRRFDGDADWTAVKTRMPRGDVERRRFSWVVAVDLIKQEKNNLVSPELTFLFALTVHQTHMLEWLSVRFLVYTFSIFSSPGIPRTRRSIKLRDSTTALAFADSSVRGSVDLISDLIKEQQDNLVSPESAFLFALTVVVHVARKM